MRKNTKEKLHPLKRRSSARGLPAGDLRVLRGVIVWRCFCDAALERVFQRRVPSVWPRGARAGQGIGKVLAPGSAQR